MMYDVLRGSHFMHAELPLTVVEDSTFCEIFARISWCVSEVEPPTPPHQLLWEGTVLVPTFKTIKRTTACLSDGHIFAM